MLASADQISELQLFTDQGKAVLKANQKMETCVPMIPPGKKVIYNLHIISNGQQETRSVMID